MASLFENITALQVCSPLVFSLSEQTTIAEALQIFSNYKIHSAPVVYQTGINNYSCYGSVDTLDIITWVIGGVPYSIRWAEDIRQRMNLSVRGAVDYSITNPFVPLPETTSLRKATTDFLAKGYHRVPLMNMQGNLSGNLSQMDVIKFLKNQVEFQQHPDVIHLRSIKLGNVRLPIVHKVISVIDNFTIYETFDWMCKNKVRGVAVLNFRGQLVGNLSASDFEGVTVDMLPKLVQTKVADIIVNQRVASVTLQNTVGDVIDAICDNFIHRVFIVNENKEPIGVISLTDIMKLLVDELGL